MAVFLGDSGSWHQFADSTLTLTYYPGVPKQAHQAGLVSAEDTGINYIEFSALRVERRKH